jgi:hypothetical protein
MTCPFVLRPLDKAGCRSDNGDNEMSCQHIAFGLGCRLPNNPYNNMYLSSIRNFPWVVLMVPVTPPPNLVM